MTATELADFPSLVRDFFTMYLYRYTNPTQADVLVKQIGTEVLQVATGEYIKEIAAAGFDYPDPSPGRWEWQRRGVDVADALIRHDVCLTDGLIVKRDGETIHDGIVIRYFEVVGARTDEGWKVHTYYMWSSNNPAEASVVEEKCS